MPDNIAILDGYMEEVHATGGGHELFLLIKPGTDLDGSFRAWDMDAQEYIKVYGWLFEFD